MWRNYNLCIDDRTENSGNALPWGQILVFLSWRQVVYTSTALHTVPGKAPEPGWHSAPWEAVGDTQINNNLIFFYVKVAKSCYSPQEAFWGNFFCRIKELGWTGWPAVTPPDLHQPMIQWKGTSLHCSCGLLPSQLGTWPRGWRFLICPDKACRRRRETIPLWLKVTGKHFPLLRWCEYPKSAFQEKDFFKRFPCSTSGCDWNVLDGTSYLACCSKETAGRKWNYCKILKSKQNQDVERSLPGATFPKAFSLRNTEGNAYHGLLVFWSFGQTLPRLLEVPPWSCRSHHTALELVWV